MFITNFIKQEKQLGTTSFQINRNFFEKDQKADDQEVLNFLENKECFDISGNENKRINLKEIIIKQYQLFQLLEETILLQRKRRSNTPIEPFTTFSELSIPIQMMKYDRNQKMQKIAFYKVNISCSIWESKHSVVVLFYDLTETIKNQKFTSLNIYKDQLLNSVSHELKTPLNSITQILEINKMETDIEKIRDNNLEAQQNCDLLNQIIQGIIIIGQEKYVPQISRFNLCEEIFKVKSLFTTSVKQKNIQLDIINNTQLDQILINNDQTAFSQVLYHLITNSIKFTNQHGKIKIMVSIYNKNSLCKSHSNFNRKLKMHSYSQKNKSQQISLNRETQFNEQNKKQYQSQEKIIDQNFEIIKRSKINSMKNELIASSVNNSNSISSSKNPSKQQLQQEFVRKKPFQTNEFICQFQRKSSYMIQSESGKKQKTILSNNTIISQSDQLNYEVSVIDNGQGIDEEFQKKLFKLFSASVNDLDQNRRHGVGLGLTISNKLAQVIGQDKIQLNSKKGIGSDFCFLVKGSIIERHQSLSSSSEDSFEQKNCKKIINSSLMEENKSKIYQQKESEEDIQSPNCYLQKLNKTQNYLFDEANFQPNNVDEINLDDQRSHSPKISNTYNFIQYVDQSKNKQNVKKRSSFIDNNNNIDKLKQYFLQLSKIKKKQFLNVLLVDDTVFNNVSLQKTLSIFGNILQIETSTSGQQTIKMIQDKIKSNHQNLYDFIFMDVNMSGMSGLECIGEINKIFIYYPDLQKPVIVTNTAYVYEEQNCIEKGADFHITKPINYYKLQVLTKDSVSSQCIPINSNHLILSSMNLSF